MRIAERTPIAEHGPARHAVLGDRRQIWWPGTARSREKANIIREADVTDAVTQKNCATTQMKSSASAQFWLIDSAQIHGTMNPMFSSAPSRARDRERDREQEDQPKMTETTTDIHMPTAAIRDALFVSSAVCAEASNPVIVYCARSRPSPQTNQKIGFDQRGRPVPEARVVDGLREHVRERLVVVRDDDEDATMTATPTMCQYAEIVFRPAVTLMLKRLMTAAAARKMT